MEILETPDAEQAILDELETWYPNQVGTSLPAVIPSTFIRVLSVGGNERNLVTDDPLLTIEVFNGRESVARNVSARVIAIIQAAGRAGKLGNEVCYGVRIATLPQNYALPSVQTHKRYISTIAPSFRRRAVTL